MRAHPRSRGENSRSSLILVLWSGSSPLTRGKQVAVRCARRVGGLIPAHAGKTGRRQVCASGWGAHPRSRGENLARLTAIENATGSSPLTRGKLRRATRRGGCTGLIPAHAGKTTSRGAGRSSLGAHPRSRGENKDGAGKDLIRWGSSPLTRGKPAWCFGVCGVRGLIPAHAGKTGASRAPCDLEGAHPRSRGENGPGPTRGAT